MYSSIPRFMWHQCASGAVRWLALEASHAALTHVVDISSPCPGCGQRLAQLSCSNGSAMTPVPITRTAPPSWLPIVKAVVSAECPACGLVIDIANTIANDPSATEAERMAAKEFSDGVTVIGGIALFFLGLSWMTSRSRSV